MPGGGGGGFRTIRITENTVVYHYHGVLPQEVWLTLLSWSPTAGDVVNSCPTAGSVDNGGVVAS